MAKSSIGFSTPGRGEEAVLEVKINLSFPHAYDVEVLSEIPSGGGTGGCLYFPRMGRSSGHGGIILRVTPHAREFAPWVGVFSSGDSSRSDRFSGVFSCPSENTLCVVAGGRGYFCTAAAPLQYQEVPVIPVTDLRAIPAQSLLVFSSFTSVMGWGGNGMVWKSSRLSLDGLEITGVDDDYVSGRARLPVGFEGVDFKLSLKTGERVGL